MDISTVLNVKNIKLNMTARTKEEVIEELTDLLIQDGAVTNKEDFIRDVWLREELGSTGFENHIAIPHGKSSGVSPYRISHRTHATCHSLGDHG
ncbi:PTS system transporter subunit IIA [Klebsiella pneumoniae]|nr:PTS system transporter subunit IIA [Klebsiella pneumoniae]